MSKLVVVASLLFVFSFPVISSSDCPKNEEQKVTRFKIPGIFYMDHIEELNLKDAIGIEELTGDQYRYFHQQIAHLENTKGDLPDPPARIRYPITDTEAYNDYITKLHLRKVAFQLFVDINDKVPWSLSDYDKDERNLLFSKRPLFVENFSWQFLDFIESPDKVFKQQNFAGKTQKETINNMAGWMTENVTHRIYVHPDKPYHEQYEVRVPQHFHEYHEGGGVGACGINSDFMCTVASATNIPCARGIQRNEGTNLHRHHYVDFPSEEMYMTHGDNPYTRGLNKVFIEGSERSNYLNLVENNPEQAQQFLDSQFDD